MLRTPLLIALCLICVSMAKTPTRIVAIGDSITQGDALRDSYRRPLDHLLHQGNYNFDFVGSHDVQHTGAPPPNPDFDPDHEGHWGWFADSLRDALPGWLAGYQPQVALVHAGTNDIFFGESVEDTVMEVQEIIDALRVANPSIRVLLAQIIPFAAANSASVPVYNAQLATMAAAISTAQSPVQIVDMYTDFDTFTMTHDGIHPNAMGEAVMADRWYAALVPVLNAFVCSVGAPGAPRGSGDLVWLSVLVVGSLLTRRRFRTTA